MPAEGHDGVGGPDDHDLAHGALLRLVLTRASPLLDLRQGVEGGHVGHAPVPRQEGGRHARQPVVGVNDVVAQAVFTRVVQHGVHERGQVAGQLRLVVRRVTGVDVDDACALGKLYRGRDTRVVGAAEHVHGHAAVAQLLCDLANVHVHAACVLAPKRSVRAAVYADDGNPFDGAVRWWRDGSVGLSHRGLA